jgi:xylan 1,4-beta-xylosidase
MPQNKLAAMQILIGLEFQIQFTKSSMKNYLFLLFLLFVEPIYAQTNIQIDANSNIGEMKPFWAYFGYDEPNYTTKPDGQKLLSELAALSPVPVYVRAHNLLTSRGDSPGPDLKWGFTDAYTEDKNGNPIYNWTVVDSIIDTYISLGMKPLMEIGFMPKALSSKPEPYEHYWSTGGNLWTGWTYPPNDYDKWRELVFQWTKHSVERYGKAEVESWLWEVWNEPDIAYWSGTFEEYCKMYDYAADGLKKACPQCTIGGPHTTSPRNDKAYTYLTKFIEHCLRGQNYATGKKGTPLEYIGFHAKGSPELVDGRIQMNMGAQLRDIQRAFEAVNSFPELKNIPVIIGECDPEGCAACSKEREPKYGYRNGTMYASYTTASFARIYELMDAAKVNLRGVVSWSFEFEDQPWFASFRDLATNGIDKPVLNVFRMFGMMQGERLAVESSIGFTANDIINAGVKKENDINAIASQKGNDIWVMVWNYHDDIDNQKSAEVALNIAHLSGQKALVTQYRIDENFSNSYEVWKAMGSPQQVSPEQYKKLERAGQLQQYSSPYWATLDNNALVLKLKIPSHGISLFNITLL